MRLAAHALSSPGGRAVNEDAVRIVIEPAFAVLALADGLGGHGGGREAARECVEAATSAFTRAPSLSETSVRAIAGDADRAITRSRDARRSPPGTMRSTLALLAVEGSVARWIHVGDSRIYWFRKGRFMRRTRDHSVAELAATADMPSAVAAADDSDRHRLTRALGSGGVRADIGDPITLDDGDRFLLCSDGLWGTVPDSDLAACLVEAPTPADCCAELDRCVRRLESDASWSEQDNYSMIVAIVNI